MSLGLTKPGMRSADLAGMIHPKTGLAIEPLYVRVDGSVVWPALGAGPDDPDDPAFTGEDDDDSDDDSDEDDEDEDDKPSKKKTTKKRKSSDDDDDEDDDEDDKPTRPERQAARYRVQLRESQKQNREMAARLKALEDKDKPADEVAKREAEEAKTKADRLATRQRALTIENAVLKASQASSVTARSIEWNDVEDMMAVAEREGLWDDVVDDDGTVDSKALRLALRDLAKRKPHLVKSKAAPKDDDDDAEDDDDEEQSSRRTAPRMNGRRRGTRQESNRAALAKKFPVLGR